jgi:hypothetical protein
MESNPQSHQEPDKWAPYDALTPYLKSEVDRIAREDFGVTLHAGSSAEEIARFVRIAKASW